MMRNQPTARLLHEIAILGFQLVGAHVTSNENEVVLLDQLDKQRMVPKL